MLTKRIIACLDVKNGRTVKGTNFKQLRDMGDPVELAQYYAAEKTDELVFLDISATQERRKTLTELVRKVAASINIPFTVGGGISAVDDVQVLLENGADKISVNTAAVKNPALLGQIAGRFGSQCLVLAVDAKRIDGDWFVYLEGGNLPTTIPVMDWVRKATDLGAGEILLTSIDQDGQRNGFDLELTRAVTETVPVPVIASGGAGQFSHFEEVFKQGKADAALAAGIFHEKLVEIPLLKSYLDSKSIHVRL